MKQIPVVGPRVRAPIRAALIAVAVAATLSACGGGGDGIPVFSGPVVLQDARASCTALAGKAIPARAIAEPSAGAKVTSATFKPAVADANNAAGTAFVPGTPDYCEVMLEFPPVDPSAPVIKSQVNLPATWNGKKLQFGGGGYNGTLVNGLAQPTTSPPNTPRPLTQGYVTAGTDSGHQNDLVPNRYQFALNDEAFANFAYASYKKTHDAAIELVKTFYERLPARSYFMGSSEGGREAMMMAQRYPKDYDGIIAVDPVINWSGMMLQGATLAGSMQARPGAWLGGKSSLVQSTVTAACDALDGIVDQVVSNYRACKPLADPALAALRCPSGADEGNSCLSDDELAAVMAIKDGYAYPFPFANGIARYPGWGYGGEALPGNWDNWWIGSVAPDNSVSFDTNHAQALRGAGGYIRYVIARNPTLDLFTFDANAYRSRILAVSEMIDATNPDLSAFHGRGGKLIMRLSMADNSQSPFNGFDYWERVVARMGRTAVDDFFAMYAATGLTHVSPGQNPVGANVPSYGIPGRSNLLAALEDWVERGTRPGEQIVLTNNQAVAPFAVTVSKPMCRYPNYPRYTGPAGGGASAANYTCVPSP